jgi:uncharacterized membrane protein
MMWGEVKKIIRQMFESYQMRKVGFIAGTICGVAILIFGVFNTLFAFFLRNYRLVYRLAL